MLKETYLDWEIHVLGMSTSSAMSCELSIAKSPRGDELVMTPTDEDGFPGAFSWTLHGTIRRVGKNHRPAGDHITLGFVQNLRTTIRAAWYRHGDREHLLTRRPIDALPLRDHSTRWYGENADALGCKVLSGDGEVPFELTASDAPHTGFPMVCPKTGAQPLMRAELGAAFTTCLVLERSWDTKVRHAIVSIDWIIDYKLKRLPGDPPPRKPTAIYLVEGSVDVGVHECHGKPVDAACIVDGGPSPNQSEHVFVQGQDLGPTANY